ncbi:MAG TPA: hypothetical protein VIH59_26175, partial [Candidatus Tectomicrobia bacterium]
MSNDPPSYPQLDNDIAAPMRAAEEGPEARPTADAVAEEGPEARPTADAVAEEGPEDRPTADAVAEEIAAHARRLELVLAVTCEITHELDLSKLLQRITQLTAGLTGSTTCVIFLWDNVSQRLLPQSWYGAGEWFGDLR